MTFNIHIVLEDDNPEDVRRVNHFASLMATHGTNKAAFRMLLDLSEKKQHNTVRLDEYSVQRVVEVMQQRGVTTSTKSFEIHDGDEVVIPSSLARKWA